MNAKLSNDVAVDCALLAVTRSAAVATTETTFIMLSTSSVTMFFKLLLLSKLLYYNTVVDYGRLCSECVGKDEEVFQKRKIFFLHKNTFTCEAFLRRSHESNASPYPLLASTHVNTAGRMNRDACQKNFVRTIVQVLVL